MKAIITGVLVVVMMAVALQFWDSSPITYVKEQVEVTPKIEVVVPEVDQIEKARQELERINQELDVKEQELLEEREAIDGELERLRETRVSFQ